MIPENLTYEQLIEDMKACEQTKGMSVLEHGLMVCDYYRDLYSHLYEDTRLKYEWKIPNWVMENKQFILNELCHDYTMQEYMIMHDCGKPYCRSVDEDGRQHFQDHANVSADVWSKMFPADKMVSELIRNDMQIHTIKSEDLVEFTKNPLAVSLLITGLCEIHANASMFGGIESTSFKIKWKQIDRRGKHIVSNLAIH